MTQPEFLVRWRPLADARSSARLAEVLAAWDMTPYRPGQQRRGVGADCVRFVAAVFDELLGRQTEITTLPPDTCMHDPAKAAAAVARLRALFDSDEVLDGSMEPGDAVVTGPIVGGPGHVMVVGPQRNTLWHAARPCVHRTGLGGIYLLGHRVFRVYRLRDRTWR